MDTRATGCNQSPTEGLFSSEGLKPSKVSTKIINGVLEDSSKVSARIGLKLLESFELWNDLLMEDGKDE